MEKWRAAGGNREDSKLVQQGSASYPRMLGGGKMIIGRNERQGRVPRKGSVFFFDRRETDAEGESLDGKRAGSGRRRVS